uniref:Uncharacterized protein n=1 Tax=Nicotiana tabacum TaxID=4097 RepID=A0A1S3WZN7_TOBAC|nr:PREDICTED: uncharacterized protein LOC107759635 [Nicotiana tabacum]
MVLGDFNSVLKAGDRIGGNPVTRAEVKDFHSCVEECGLLEVPAQGNRYTWKDKHEEQRIFSKIDWVFTNGEWLDVMPACRAIFLPEGISDYRPAKVSLIEERRNFKKSFQFCNMWAQHPQFNAIVQEGWTD